MFFPPSPEERGFQREGGVIILSGSAYLGLFYRRDVTHRHKHPIAIILHPQRFVDVVPSPYHHVHERTTFL